MKLKKLWRYFRVLLRRIYRPIKPVASPLLKKIKLIYLLIALLIIGGIGNYQYWVEKKAYEESLRQKAVIIQEIESWEKVLETKPEYRDILLRLALLNWKIYNNDKAKEYWEKANYLDPNNIEVQKVGKIIFPARF
jgi:tetratricopeptide (TPR) repeat protein